MSERKPLLAAGLLLFCFGFPQHLSAQDAAGYDASGDYIRDCSYATCVKLLGSEWSENNPFGVAVSVRMGTQPAMTDDQIKLVLTRDFKRLARKEVRCRSDRTR